MLMKFGCRIKARNCNNQKPYDIAKMNDDTDAMAMFSDQIQSLFGMFTVILYIQTQTMLTLMI